jgi:hypothetical protein
MASFDFQIYQRETNRGPANPVPTVRVQANNIMFINAAAAQLIGDPDRVLLLFDPDARVVGIQGTTEDDPNGFVVTRKSKQGGTVGVQRFCEAHRIRRGESYEAWLQEGLLMFEVGEPV